MAVQGPSKPRLTNKYAASQTWSAWASSFIWTPDAAAPLHAVDASHDPALRKQFLLLLDNTEPPGTFKASEVAQLIKEKDLARLGYEKWEEALPAVIELAFELREFGYCDLLKKGKVLAPDLTPWDIEGGVRIRRREMREADEW